MLELTFGEQVKIVLNRKDMTIKQLAEMIEERTGKKMSRQNLTQRLGRDNFQEQDMRMIASILDCPFQLSILGGESAELTPAVCASAPVSSTPSMLWTAWPVWTTTSARAAVCAPRSARRRSSSSP